MQDLSWRLAGAALVALLASSHALGQVPVYKVTELVVGPKADTTLYSIGRGINKSGQTVIEFGYSSGAGYAAGRCSKGSCTLVPELGTLAASATTPWGLNDLGAVTGSSAAGGTTHAFLFDGASSLDLGSFPEDGCGGCSLESHGRDVNNLGQTVGRATTGAGAVHAFMAQGAALLDLGTLGGDSSEARAVNDKGDVAGVADLPGGAQRAFLYSAGVMSNLGTLGGNHSAALAINEARQVVGCSTLAGEVVRQAFVYRQGAMQPLPSLGGDDSCAMGINRNAWVVGYSTLAGAWGTRATVHDGVQTVDLNTRLDPKTGKKWVLQEARAINDQGMIVGTGVHNGVTRAFLLTPMASH